ncbi:DUF3500 domain-containing protein [Pleomorphovibrio marinus]|uniref:DUF3500 domain-containing protein n=1 Tax=Pleomorphovibrio marinus TaxID=2164132 RepID=UPI000E0C9BBB|nr:DUF3500 domain-containing protein [Pleomorphovibrio marinus]
MKQHCILWSICLLFAFPLLGQDLSQRAGEFLNSLSSEIKEKATFPFDHSERFNWHFIPRDRKGANFHDFNEKQRKAALRLLKASMGDPGVEKTEAIFELEKVLRVVEDRPANDRYRDPENYYFSIFGDPSSDKPWGWRLEGHHVSLNFSSANNKIISSTPTFLGSNPAIVPGHVDLHTGMQVLVKETNGGFELLHSLDKGQLELAIYDDKAPYDIITGNDRKVSLLSPKGISYTQLSPDQQRKLLELLGVYLANYSKEIENNMWEKIKQDGYESLHFAWAGSTKNAIGEPHYYRIQCPSLLIEYDNVQNNANHVHTVVRDLSNDFGEDVLRNHYTFGHSHKKRNQTSE